MYLILRLIHDDTLQPTVINLREKNCEHVELVMKQIVHDTNNDEAEKAPGHQKEKTL